MFSYIRFYCIPVHQHAFSGIECRDITLFVLGASNPRRVAASLGFKFEERVNIFLKKTTLASVRIVFRHFLFVQLHNIWDLVTLLNG